MSSLQLPERRLSCVKLTFAAALALVASVMPVKAQTNVYTDPVGFITLTVVGTNGLGGATSYLGLSMTQIVTNRGNITALAPFTVGVNQTLTAGQFNEVIDGSQTNPAFFVEVTSGANAGLFDDVLSNDTANLYTVSDDSSLMATGETYKVYPHWNLASVFGATDQAGVNPADNILVQNPSGQSFTTYFYSTGGKAGTGWRSATGGTADQSTVPLYIDQGLTVRRTTVGTNLTVMLVGAPKLGSTVIPISPKYNYVGNVYATSTITLSNSALYTGVDTTGLTPSDTLLIHNDNTGSFTTYFYSTGGKAGVGWRSANTGTTDVSGTTIPQGANIILDLAAGEPGFNWVEPAPY